MTEDPRIAALPDIHGHAKGEHKPFAEERPIPYTARMLFLWFYHACRRGSPRFLMVADHMNYLTFEDPAAVNLVRRALKLAQAGDLYGAAETAGVDLGHAQIVSEGLRKGIRYSIGAEVDNDPRCRPDAQNIVDAMRPDGMIRSVHFLAITHPQHGENWMWPFDNPEFAELFEVIGTERVWELYMATLLEAIEKLPGHIVAHFYVPAKFGHWPDDAALDGYEDRLLDACAERGMAVEVNSRYIYKFYAGDEAQLERFRSAHVRLLRKAKAKGVAVAVGSDAHSPKDQGRAFDAVLALLDEAEINEIAFPINGRLARVALRATEEILRQQSAAAVAPPPVETVATSSNGSNAAIPETAETAAPVPVAVAAGASETASAAPEPPKKRPSRKRAPSTADTHTETAAVADESTVPAAEPDAAAPAAEAVAEDVAEAAESAVSETPVADGAPAETVLAETVLAETVLVETVLVEAVHVEAVDVEVVLAETALEEFDGELPAGEVDVAQTAVVEEPVVSEPAVEEPRGHATVAAETSAEAPELGEGDVDAEPAAAGPKPAAKAKPRKKAVPARPAPAPVPASAVAPAKPAVKAAARPAAKTAATKSRPAKATAAKAVAKKAVATKPAAKKAAPKTAASKKIAARPAAKAAAKKAAPKKAAARPAPAKAPKKAPVKRATPVKKSAAKKPVKKKTARPRR